MHKVHKLSVRLTKEQFSNLEDRANIEGLSVSSHVRRLLTFREFINTPALFARYGSDAERAMFVSDGQDP